MNEAIAVACGGGVNMAMILGMYERGIKPFVITFADTKGEKPGTYAAIEAMNKWCEDHMGIGITTVTKTSMYASLEDQSLRTETLPSAAYGFRSCSDKWKIQPQNKFRNSDSRCKKIWAQGEKVTIALGYDAGESRRGDNLKEDAKYRYRFPLKEWGWFREDCIAAFVRHGLAVPPKSACFYCPSSTKAEVIKLAKEEPELFERAVAIERAAAPGLKTVKGLGRHWTWEGLVQISNDQMQLLPEAPQMNCVCFDSEE